MNTNYLTEDFLCILFLALIFYLQFYFDYVTFNKDNYDTHIDFEATLTRRLFIILMISIVSYISFIKFINFELYRTRILSFAGRENIKPLYMFPNSSASGDNDPDNNKTSNVIENENKITNKGDSNNKSNNDNSTKTNVIKNKNIINNEDKGKGKDKANPGSTSYNSAEL